MLSKHLPPRTNRQLQCLRNASLRNPNASGSSSAGHCDAVAGIVDGQHRGVELDPVVEGGGQPERNQRGAANELNDRRVSAPRGTNAGPCKGRLNVI